MIKIFPLYQLFSIIKVMKKITNIFFSDEKTFWRRMALILSIAACFTFLGCNNFLPSPNISQASDIVSLNGKAITSPLNVSATHGQKKQITVSWTPVSNAKYYFIYRADTPHSEFVQIEEAAGEETSKAVSVPAGYSGYFKVAAVSGLGEISELSLSSYGTSLATPIITDIQQDDSSSSATVYWYMENLNEKSYLSSVQFLVTCYNTDGSEKEHQLITSTEDTFCTFNNLNTATLYRYDVEAYLKNDQASSEKSAKLDRLTAVSLIPQIAQFTATEGTEKDKKVTLTITLPQMAKTLVSAGAGGNDISDYEDKPLYFKIQRFNETTQEFDPIEDYLSFNGSTTPLDKDHADFALYTEGNKVTWSDTNIERGIIYKYRVLSYVDNYFEDGSTTTRKSVTHDASKANVEIGWAANLPAISSTPVEYTKATAVCETDPSVTAEYIASASTKLNASWNGLGKEEEYHFYVVEKHFKLKNDNGDVEDTTGETKIIVPEDGRYYFDSTEEIRNFEIPYNFAAPEVDVEGNKTDVASNADVRGYYNYFIYVIPKSLGCSSVEEITANALASAVDSSTRLIVNIEVSTPVLTVEDGYKNKAVITYNKAADTTYKLVRETLDENGNVIVGEEKTVNVSDSATYEDTTLEAGKAYQYTLYATTAVISDVPSSTIRAFTLAEPDLTFDDTRIDYSTVTLKWHSAVSSLEKASIAEGISTDRHVKYEVKVPYKGTTFTYDLSSHQLDGTNTVKFNEADYTLEVINGSDYYFTLKKNVEYFTYGGKVPKISAEDAGKNFNVTLVVSNDLTATYSDNHNDKTVQAHTLGPANANITATKAEQIDNIKVRWYAIPGVEYYAVRRTCPGLTAAEDSKDDILYVAKDGTVTVNSEAVSKDRTVVSPQTGYFILTDQHCAASDSTDSYQTNQAKIAWGLEYEYTVIPVLSTDDNPFEDFAKVEYTFPAITTTKAKGYTPGYGLNVTASKADAADSVTVTWDKPNSFAYAQPKLWYRKFGSTDWNHGPLYAPGTLEGTINLPETLRANKVEFAVSYDTNEVAQFDSTYLSALAAKTDKDGEAYNVGYQFTLTTFYVTSQIKTAETYSEQINWSKYQNGDRKKGVGDNIDGDCYEIQMMNKNCSDKWYTIATLNKNGEYHPVDMTDKWYDINVVGNSNTSATITPGHVSDSGGVHDGLLKVQRDYKHYYRLVAKRKTSAEGTEITAVLGDFTNTSLKDTVATKAVYGMRKISDEEFVKNISLIIADAAYKCGVNESASGDTLPTSACISGATGKFGLYHRGGTKNAYWGTKDTYQHIFYAMPSDESESLTSGWSINIPEKGDRGAADGNKYYYFTPADITVTHESGLPSYAGTLSFCAGTQGHKSLTALTDGVKLAWNLSITSSHGNKTYSVSGDEIQFKNIFPYQLGASNTGYSAFDASLPVFQNKWWEVRD